VKGLKSNDEGVKEEVSYGAVIYNQIMSCLRSAKGKDVVLRFEAGSHPVVVKDYEDYKTDVDHLVSLVSIIGDDEFWDEMERLDMDFKTRRKKLVDDNEYEDDEIYIHNQKLIYEYSFKRFNAVLRLLKRQGVIVESLLRGYRF